MSALIEDYGIIGNTYTAALVSREGSIDWLCLPRFDSDSVFSALLGEPKHGRWLISPADRLVRSSRCYRNETGILETRFETPEGSVKVVDLHDQEQILLSPEDGILGDTDFFQFREQGRPNLAMCRVILRLLASPDTQPKRQFLHLG